MMRAFLSLGALFGLLGVCLGAFGAHELHGEVSGRMLAVFNIGLEYQFYHALALLAVGLLLALWPGNRLLQWAGGLFTAGVVMFSGSLYVLAISGVRWLGAITPVGGFSLIAGWVLLLIACLRGAG